jgi:beta-carotene hydroxylase
VGLALVCLGTVAGSVGATAAGALPWPVALLASSVACFAGFTPVHEATHRNVSRSRALNDAVGHLCALLVLGALLPYRFLHGEHHRHTNDARLDPDHWSGSGRALALPLRWASQDLGYLAFYARAWSSRPALERANLVGCAALYAGAALLATWAGPHVLLAVVAGWLLPARLALWALAATFAWLPHAPHTSTDRYRATSVRSAPLWNWLLLGQSYHLVHHLQPGVPFYRLAATWRAQREALLARGAVDHSAVALVVPEAGQGLRGCGQRGAGLR